MKKEWFVEKTFHLTTACGGASPQVNTDLIAPCHSEGAKQLKNLSIFAGFFAFAQNDNRENTN